MQQKYALGEIVLFRFPAGTGLRAGLVMAVSGGASGWAYSLRDLYGQTIGVLEADILVGNGGQFA